MSQTLGSVILNDPFLAIGYLNMKMRWYHRDALLDEY